MKNALTYFITLVIFVCQSAMASSPERLFEEANSAYESEQIDSAKTLYNQLINQGYTSHQLHYNLGNAHFKSGEVAQSILHYERALKLKPNDEDTRHNLNVANGQITDEFEELPSLFITNWWKGLITLFAPSTWWIIAIVLFWVFVAFVTLFILTKDIAVKKRLVGGIVSALVIMVLTVIISIFSYIEMQSHDNAIVMKSSVSVFSEPQSNATELYVIHSGLKVEIQESNNNWIEVRLPNGNKGWIPQTSVTRI
ncbi:tetratricopeptide repeat protein [Salibacter halophilus]|uniref:Tetratricopeptide repeat protein n=1 Tax=Salibacter halophilus TaxID=1803916 RepID=A0A6N6M8W8_9FLAO|nr:tetratricopeptide repeat protein [Salibacter halophilus]KAB1065506.1 tetratricopeptide repeat protein [Salibacter halophilus]